MKKILFCLLILIVTVAANAQSETAGQPYLTKSFANATIKNADVKTSGGSIFVTGVNAADARVEVYINANNGSENLSGAEIKKRLEEDYNFDVSLSGNMLGAIAKLKDKNRNRKKSISISFKVFAPVNINSDLATSGGSISLTNLSGSQEFSTSGGSLHVNKVSGKTKGATSGGSIHVVDCKDNISLTTSGGSIDAENCSGDLNLSTSGGSIDLNNLKGNIEANTSGGSINGNNIAGELSTGTSGGSVRLNNLTCSLEASTSSGSIDVTMKELGKYIKISNSGGNINLTIPRNKGVDLKLSGQKVSAPAISNFTGSMDKNEVDGKINGGGIPVTVRADGGKVNLAIK